MASATNGTNTITYGYDANGLRHTKTVDGVEYKYYYAGDKLVRETFGSTVIDFFYDPDGRPYAMKYNALVLYYVLNQQGDVVRLVDSEGVNYGSYKYDAWGNILQKADTKYINNNPLRYRGYVYDPETELYYCQSRYYDPKIGRFLNADALVSTGQGILGNNMFAYCNNNPVMFEDESGCSLKPSTVYMNDSTGGDRHVGTTNSHDAVASNKKSKMASLKFAFNTIYNSDESIVLKSRYFAFYKGQLVIRHDLPFTNGRSASFGIMFLHIDETNPETVKHEWGHYEQLKIMGVVNYMLSVALPSVTSDPYNPDYYSNPWERTADLLGDVNRTRAYKEGSLIWGLAQFIIGPLSVPLYYLFGN